MKTLRQAFRPFTKIFICTGLLALFLNQSLPQHLHSCAHGPSWAPRQFCSDLIDFGHVYGRTIMSLLCTFAIIAAVYALKRWLSNLWDNTGALIIDGSPNLPSSHFAVFLWALFGTIFRLVVGLVVSFFAAILATVGTVHVIYPFVTNWIGFDPVSFSLYFAFSYCVVSFLLDNALARSKLWHTLATKLDSVQEMKLSENVARSGKDEIGQAKKKSIFYI